MKITYKKLLLIPTLALALSACSDSSSENDNMKDMDEENMDQENMDMDSGSEESMNMDHSGSGEVPGNLAEAENPTYEVGSQVIIKADHMEGMKDAKATIVGAYDTTAYAISYTPTNGGERVENHKWVIQEEIKDASDEIFQAGTEIVIEAEHMEAMDGATAEINLVEETTVYMIDYTPTTGGEEVTNHKWVTESELSAE